MNPTPDLPPSPAPTPVPDAPDQRPPEPVRVARAGQAERAWPLMLAAVAAVLSTVALGVSCEGRDDQHQLERELVKRQGESRLLGVETAAQARAAEAAARDAQVKATLLETRLAESTAQRSQLESMMLALSRSRDENAVNDIEALLRASMTQSTWTGRIEPVVTALKQADERLGSLQSPRLAALRKAVSRDVDRLGAANVVDAAAVALRLDGVLATVDEMVLTVQTTDRAAVASSAAAATRSVKPVAAVVAAAATGLPTPASWRDQVGANWAVWKEGVLQEFRSLVRISRVDQPGAMLIAPEQAYFVRENLKLRLLSARLAVLSRQHDVAQRDLKEAQKVLDGFFDRTNRRVVEARVVVAAVLNTPSSNLPRPDETLNALALLSRTP